MLPKYIYSEDIITHSNACCVLVYYFILRYPGIRCKQHVCGQWNGVSSVISIQYIHGACYLEINGWCWVLDTWDVAHPTDHLVPCGIISNVPRQPPTFSHSCSHCRRQQVGNDDKILYTRNLGALRAPTSSQRPFGPLYFVLRALRPVNRAQRDIRAFFENQAFFFENRTFLNFNTSGKKYTNI